LEKLLAAVKKNREERKKKKFTLMIMAPVEKIIHLIIKEVDKMEMTRALELEEATAHNQDH